MIDFESHSVLLLSVVTTILSPGSGRLASPVQSCKHKVKSLSRKERKGHEEKIPLEFFALLYVKTPLAQIFGDPWLSKTGICSRQDAKNAKSGSLISLRPLRLCGRYFRVLVAALPR
jgi:hypothetical protein